MRPSPRFLAMAILALAPPACAGPIPPATPPQGNARPPASLYDPRLDELRRASVFWDFHLGPKRRVVDQVCLVADLPSFLEALSAWDGDHIFPILLDDAIYAPKFLRAFRPAKIVRLPYKPGPIEPGRLWAATVKAVEKSWAAEPVGPPLEAIPSPVIDEDFGAGGRFPASRRPARVPEELGRTPPGVVLSSPDAPGLAAAAALAAGHIQPLVRLDPPGKAGVMSQEEALAFGLSIETAVSSVAPRYAGLADSCDFLTVVGPYPDRYTIAAGSKAGPAALDDLIGRDRDTGRRWAYTGRIVGDPVASVYRAMCSLFLQPDSALLFDGYDPKDPGFAHHLMKNVPERMPKRLAVTAVPHPTSDLDAWHRALDPLNRFGLVYVNTSGPPSTFNLPGGRPATAADVPESVPTIVLMNHSFSAASPGDPRTLAGRWLENGAFYFFGSMNEPYIVGFRPPSLVASILFEGLPVSAAVRITPDESREFGTPWRLHLLGDPLYRISPEAGADRRLASSPVTPHWPPYVEDGPRAAPARGSNPAAKVAWALKATLIDASKGDRPPDPVVVETILAVRREELPPGFRAALDGMRIDLVPRVRSARAEALGLLVAIPPAERSQAVSLAIETFRVGDLQAALLRKDWPGACSSWDALIRSDSPRDVKSEVTARTARLAEALGSLRPWKDRLDRARRELAGSPDAEILRAEIARVEKAIEDAGGGPSVRRR